MTDKPKPQTPLTPEDAKALIKRLPTRPGVYRMVSAQDQVLYVGKAKNLKNRVSSYFRKEGLTAKHMALMSQTVDIEHTITSSEGEALLLENNLIKKHKPRFNVMLRDDKSYPYISVDMKQAFPRLQFYRGVKKKSVRMYGPFPSAYSVRETLGLLHKLFQIRQCEDTVFNNRSRPCLQYQIKRCTAPCVDYISREDYGQDINNALLFLEGRSAEVIDSLVEKMEHASAQQNYELAAKYRDQIKSLRRVTEHQYAELSKGELDIIAAAMHGNQACVQVFFIRNGRNLGNKYYFPKIPKGESLEEMMTAFVSQFYQSKMPPNEILLSVAMQDQQWLGDMLSEQKQAKVKISSRPRAQRAKWVQMAQRNADHMLKLRLQSKLGYQERFQALSEALQLDVVPSRIECFDISHSSGDQTVASCVVFNQEGALKQDYRRFNIKEVTKGDDYAALQQATQRRFTRVIKEEGAIPDVVLIDGGKGQLNSVVEALSELSLENMLLVGVAKGADRRVGQERLFLSNDSRPIILPEESAALHLVQEIRDEAHRFAISGHRQRQRKKQTGSILDEINGMGPKRRQSLIKQFGGMRQLESASVEDLASVKGISDELAQRIYNALHPDTD